MVKDLFDINGKFYALCSRIFDMVLLSFLWYICCLPLVMILPATSALYHATVKCVQHDRGKAGAEFMDLFRRILKRDLAVSAAGSLLLLGEAAGVIRILRSGITSHMDLFRLLSLGLAAFFTFLILFWRGLVGSRADGPLEKLLQVGFVLSVRHLPQGICMLLIAGTALLTAYVFPPALLVLPSLLIRISFCMTEPVLEHYYPSDNPEE